MTTEELKELVISYATNKKELDSYKKLCDAQNMALKKELKRQGMDSLTAGGYTVKYSIQHRESLDEDVVLSILLRHRGELPVGLLKSIIKTKEYVDMDELENAIYTHLIPEEVVVEMSKAYSSKEVETLKVTRKKEGE